MIHFRCLIYKKNSWSFYNSQFFPANKSHMLFKMIVSHIHFKYYFLSQLSSEQPVNAFLHLCSYFFLAFIQIYSSIKAFNLFIFMKTFLLIIFRDLVHLFFISVLFHRQIKMKDFSIIILLTKLLY
jgi:hypothetical protein